MDGLFCLVGGVVGPQDFHVIPWHFDNGASSKIDDVVGEDGGLLHVIPLAVHLMDKEIGLFLTILTY